MIYITTDKTKMKRQTKKLGRVLKTQMYKPYTKNWLLQRINPQCENCNGNDYYIIISAFFKPLGLMPIGKTDEIIRITCPNCGEAIELDHQEYLLIQPFVKLNSMLDSGKIDDYEYKYRQEKIEGKYIGS